MKAELLLSGNEKKDLNLETETRTLSVPARSHVKTSMPSLLQSPVDDIVSIRALLQRCIAKARRDKHDSIRGKGP